VYELRLMMNSGWEGSSQIALPFFQAGFTDLDEAGLQEMAGNLVISYEPVQYFQCIQS
jgi:hypothetical protein